MKRLLFLCLMLCVGSVIWTYAQHSERVQRTPEQEATKHTEMMRRDLQLSTEQIDTVYRLNLKYAKARRSATSREELFAFIEKKRQELQRILTKNQFEQYIIRQHSRHAKRQSVIKMPQDTVENEDRDLQSQGKEENNQ